METINLPLNKNIADMASAYATARGETLASMVERYLTDLVAHVKIGRKQEAAPEAVMSLLGAGCQIDADDLDGRKAYAEHLKQKHL